MGTNDCFLYFCALMLRVKKIYIYILKQFLGLLAVTFLICIFILLMQFVWMHVNDLVGKGVGIVVLAEFFLYAVVSVTSLALPLAILLASLMTFGNLGEKSELTAMKAAGISLFRIMRPLMVCISFICIGAFFFSNYVVPVSESKLWTLIFSLRQKSPEVDIPVGEFYDGIQGYNIYVREKDSKQKLLKDLMIYDFSNGFNNATVMVADSGRVYFTKDNKYLLLELYNGESFENLKKQNVANASRNIPYRREVFENKKLLIDFDSEFNRFDESLMADQHISKTVVELKQSIDSVTVVAERRVKDQSSDIICNNYFGRESEKNKILEPVFSGKVSRQDLDSIWNSMPVSDQAAAVRQAAESARRMNDKIAYNKLLLSDSIMYIRRHEIYMHRKFTLSFACLIFFFIGAPLGAIIRKGGLGAPTVISVVMFIFYYIIDNTGYKMAREGVWTAFEGMWLSSAVLLPIGIFLSYKAATDSALFNPDAWVKWLHKEKEKCRQQADRLRHWFENKFKK